MEAQGTRESSVQSIPPNGAPRRLALSFSGGDLGRRSTLPAPVAEARSPRVLASAIGVWALAMAVDIAAPLAPVFRVVLGALQIAGAAVVVPSIGSRWRAGFAPRGVALVEAAAIASVLLFVYAKSRVLVELALEGLEDGADAALGDAGVLYSVLLFASAAAGLVARSRPLRGIAALSIASPARLMVTSFVVAIGVGTLLLTLPISVARLESVSVLDALFTATSAACVTGLAVNDVSQAYTRFGHVVIALLVQAGGLGIMTLGATAAAFAGRRLRVRSAASMAELLDADSLASLRRLVRRIVVGTVLIETAGAAALYPAFRADPRTAGDAVFHAAFHAVTAFCNAGFALFSDNLVGFVHRPDVCGIIALLVLLGGLGFPVLDELATAAVDRIRRAPRRRLTLHARLALAMSGALVLAGALPILLLELGASMAHLPWPSRALAALFTSISARTAGFNTVDLGRAHPATLLLVMGLMFIGASPASTGGGTKTTTFAVFLASLRAHVRGRPRAEIAARTLPEAVLSRALTVTAISAVVAAASGFALLVLEDHAPLRLLFEACSAFGTAGLSTGITASLGAPAKLVLIATMLVGRVGPLTVALALGESAPRRPVAYPEERVLVG